MADDDAESAFLALAHDSIAGGNSMSRAFDRWDKIRAILLIHALLIHPGNTNQFLCSITFPFIISLLRVSPYRFMGSYVLLERQNLEEMLGKLSQEEDIADSSNNSGQGQGESIESSSSSSSSSAGYTIHGHVYNSSTSMFVFIKNSIKRCTALSNCHTFLLLCKGP